MTHTLEELIPDYIQGLPAYVPGRPVEEVEQELKIHAVKLASNENPLGPSPKAMEAARRALGEANWYPDGGSKRLREVLAARNKVRFEEVFVGLGSSEIIDLASRVLLRPGLDGITSEGSFTLFAIAIRASGGNLIQTPMRHYTFDLDAIAAAVTPQTRVIYIANPNNPTGTAFGAAEFSAFLKKVPGDVLVVLDEAYREYAARPDLPNSHELFREYNNILTLRTFSKVYGLAGLRIGYGIGHPTLVAEMNKLRTPFNVTSVGQAAALAALDDYEHVQRSVEMNRIERRRLYDELRNLGFSPVPSECNFLFVPIGPHAKVLCDQLLLEGVIVRPMGWMGFPEAIRISVGNPDQNTKLLVALASAQLHLHSNSILTPQ
ncbi:MAG TPA: histidinol-phosphate transaminase [Candidatus Eremiobacteraceae bacterium]|nr:histidinol-phosphate transaminase [Candidatus Eremiobacteraceae bacterium]